MTTVGQREILTQQRVIALFKDKLGYHYLGAWKDRPGSDNVEDEHLIPWLQQRGHPDGLISKALHKLNQATAVGAGKTLYDANREVYRLLRYGVKVSPGVGQHTETVWMIDWDNPENNDFALAEEVTVAGVHDKRPDIVLYVNGIALGVLELKRSTVALSEGIRQNLINQNKEFVRPFFSTVQLLMAGNETQGLRYGVIETPEEYYLRWKESPPAAATDGPLLRELSQLCCKDRLLELIHDFVVFDAGTKKICRHNQYFGVRAAQEYVKRRDGGIVWHTQGSGKSLTMVWLAKWIREHLTNPRVLIITDRTELDQQIEKVFKGVSEEIYRTKSGADLVGVLNASEEWLVGSLVQKFGASEEGDVDRYIQDIQDHLPKDFEPKGEIFVFVDECHRTQSGKLHRAMRTVLPASTLIGFTGTPLLKRDKRTSLETFGPYIHTYKYDEAVKDGVVLDLRYEARDINQRITSPSKIDQWFEQKTKGLTALAKAQLKQRWGTMQKLLSSEDRLKRIVADIVWDMGMRRRLSGGHGNALLVSGSIYQACRLFEMLQKTPLKGKCAVVTSYRPMPADITGEETGAGETEKLLKYGIYRKMLADHFDEPEESAMYKVDQFETDVKKRFIEQPGQMKLLIVVDKLLTGFDAPPATYLYIDKQMRDHGLFQAICRVNRLHSEDKEYGYVVDYKDLFKSLEQAITEYTGEAFAGYDAEDVAGLLENRLEKGRQRLEECRESIKALCEPVDPPRDTAAYLSYFCTADGAGADELKDNEPKRLELYKMTGALLRAYADLANEMAEAGYSVAETADVRSELKHFESVRDEVKLASGDYIDLKMYEPAMRHLLDTFVSAEDTRVLSTFNDLTLVQLIVEHGQDAIQHLPEGIRKDEKAVAETIENNVRRLIVDKHPVNPKYYDDMSRLLDALVKERRQEALEYETYLARLVKLTREVTQPANGHAYPPRIDTAALQALYDNLGQDEELALALNHMVLTTKRDGWRGNNFKRKEVKRAVAEVLANHDEAGDVSVVFELIVQQREY